MNEAHRDQKIFMVRNIAIRLSVIAMSMFICLSALIIIGFGGSSLHAPRLAIEITKFSVLIATACLCIASVTPRKLLLGRSKASKLFRFVVIIAAIQPIIVTPIAYKYFRHAL
jgi:hypothetical protein